MSSAHKKWMKIALNLAQRGLGNVAPNPAVGCVLVKNGILVGRGWTMPGGRPHAETIALEAAGGQAKGAVAYVTLEPCSHYGQTPPCVGALIKAGIKSVFIAIQDPDPRVAGKGIAALKSAGIAVTVGVLADQATTLNSGFLMKTQANRPQFILKIASSIDGKIATKSGESKWITGIEARHYGHMLRARNDAILVGVNTVIADDPSLDCRLDGLKGSTPQPIVLDSCLQTPPETQFIARAARTPRPALIVCNRATAATEQASALRDAGAELIPVRDTRDLRSMASALGDRGITRVLVEGGALVHASFVRAGYCDEMALFTAGKILGADGLDGIANLGLAQLASAPHLKLESCRMLGADLLATYVNAG